MCKNNFYYSTSTAYLACQALYQCLITYRRPSECHAHLPQTSGAFRCPAATIFTSGPPSLGSHFMDLLPTGRAGQAGQGRAGRGRRAGEVIPSGSSPQTVTLRKLMYKDPCSLAPGRDNSEMCILYIFLRVSSGIKLQSPR